MDQGKVNPYAPPVPAIKADSISQPKGSWVLSLAAGVYSFAYIVSTLFLLRSTESYSDAGVIFTLNVPTLIALIFIMRISRKVGTYVCQAFLCVHFAITIFMYTHTGTNGWSIVVINVIVMMPILAIGLLAWAPEFQVKPNRS